MWMYAFIGVSVLAWFWNKYQQHEHEKKILVMNKVQSRTVEEFHHAQEKRRKQSAAAQKVLERSNISWKSPAASKRMSTREGTERLT